jgi:hypothetical protein
MNAIREAFVPAASLDKGLDALRAVGFLWTCLFHGLLGLSLVADVDAWRAWFGPLSSSSPWMSVITAGMYGPVVFFVLAGFLTASKTDVTNPLAVIVRRFIRLWPVMAFWQFVTPRATCPALSELAFLSIDPVNFCNVPSWSLLVDFQCFVCAVVLFWLTGLVAGGSTDRQRKLLVALVLLLIVPFSVYRVYVYYYYATTVGSAAAFAAATDESVTQHMNLAPHAFAELLTAFAPDRSSTVSLLRLQGTEAGNSDLLMGHYMNPLMRSNQYFIGVLAGLVWSDEQWRQRVRSFGLFCVSAALMGVLIYYYSWWFFTAQFIALSADVRVFLNAFSFTLFAVVFAYVVFYVATPTPSASSGVPVLRNLARVLSAASYPGYLANVVVALAVGFNAGAPSTEELWSVTLRSFGITLAVGLALHLAVERPSIWLSDKVGALLGANSKAQQQQQQQQKTKTKTMKTKAQ